MGMSNVSGRLFAPELVVHALRDSGYRSAAHALAELIDNSIQASATNIDLMIGEEYYSGGQRTRKQATKIAVLDNASGMSEDVLSIALEFGNGTRLDATSGIGKFGMGLPSASISQCKRVDVWTWQEGVNNAIHSYLDVDEIRAGQMVSVPLPNRETPPDIWFVNGTSPGKTGTLIVWSKIDRCMWKTGQAIVNNSDFLIGRMYRKFIANGDVKIKTCIFDLSAPDEAVHQETLPNDPLYLISPSSTPAPYSDKPMFIHAGDGWQFPFRIDFQGGTHEVMLRFSVAPPEVRKPQNGTNAGDTDYGRHAKRNIGISILREGRELELDTRLLNVTDTRERWWGAEIDFPASLDVLMGVTNNKQEARNMSIAAAEFESVKDNSRDFQNLLAKFAEDENPVGTLLELINKVNTTISGIRQTIQVQNAGSRARHDSHGAAESQAENATKQRVLEDGQTGQSDEPNTLTDAEREAQLTEVVSALGLDEADVQGIVATALGAESRYVWLPARIEGGPFFSVSTVAGEIVVKINVLHPAYDHFIGILDTEDYETLTKAELVEKLVLANRGLKLLLMAWARYEDEAPTQAARERIQDARTDWGRVARRFLAENDD